MSAGIKNALEAGKAVSDNTVNQWGKKKNWSKAMKIGE